MHALIVVKTTRMTLRKHFRMGTHFQMCSSHHLRLVGAECLQNSHCDRRALAMLRLNNSWRLLKQRPSPFTTPQTKTLHKITKSLWRMFLQTNQITVVECRSTCILPSGRKDVCFKSYMILAPNTASKHWIQSGKTQCGGKPCGYSVYTDKDYISIIYIAPPSSLSFELWW